MSDVPDEPSIPIGKAHALIVAAGRGSRFGGPMPKQYRRLGNRSVLRHSVLAFLDHSRIESVRIAIHADDIALYRAAVGDLDLPEPVAGGATRQESVRALIEAAGASAGDVVLIHDAARPFVSPPIIDRAIDAALRAGAGAVAIPVTDTLKRADGDHVGATVDRAGLWRAQTPQSFRFDLIRAAHEAAIGLELTDDAAVAEHAGHRVELVMGHEDNFKITTEADLVRAENLLFTRLGDVRTGTGFDVHRFTDGDFCWINGIRVPHAQSLLGHSDADVGLHAITDAILGALGAGDIGQHFPPTDARWRGAASDKFLRHAADLVAERGGVIAHVDVTVICERPKIGPHRPAMVARIAEILEIAPDRVSVKATTTEELGFTGRREGIAAQAVATIRLPFAGFGGGDAG